MQRIEIENFGPIKHVTFDINDYTVFIGPQTSGKSTIARLVYFFLSLEEELSVIFFDKDGSFVYPTIERWKEKLLEKFDKYWDRSFLHEDTQISFFIDDSRNISLNFKNGSLNVTMSELLESVFNQVVDIVANQFEQTTKINIALAKLSFSYMKPIFSRNVLSGKSIYYEYIPDGRTIFSVLHNELTPAISSINDVFVQEFILTTNYIRRELAKQSIEERFQSFRKSLSSDLPKNIVIAEKIYNLSFQILHGKYCCENSIDFIYTDTDKKIPLTSSSSGQQEAIWILYHLLFHEMARVDANIFSLFTIIEEPESHLFPEGQRNMMYALTLFANHSKNQLMLTTHSPYILTPLSNLLYAFTLGQDETKREDVSKIIDPDLWIDPKRFECYYVDNGTIESVIDRETNIINLDKLDMASTLGNEEFDKLLELEG
jgi:energy-coupling factor transporter ATP-binding protein EcfA2